MGVGDSLELPWTLQGSLPAGNYLLRMRGFQPSLDGVLRIDLIHRGAGGDEVVASAMLTSAMQNVDGGFPGDFDASIPAAAVMASCGDQLVLRVKLVSGTSPYSDFYPTLTTP